MEATTYINTQHDDDSNDDSKVTDQYTHLQMRQTYLVGGLHYGFANLILYVCPFRTIFVAIYNYWYCI